MSTGYVQINRAPLMYITNDGEYKKVFVQAIKDVKISNSFNIPYVRGVVGFYNALISRMMYFSTYFPDRKLRPHQKAQELVYFPAHQIASTIDRCESQSYNIIRTLERILDIHVVRAHEHAGANTFRLSQRWYEFLHIFTNKKLEEFITKYNINSYDQYALRQIYNYRVIRPSDNNLDGIRQEFYTFAKSRRHRNFVHFCSRNNETYDSRIKTIEMHIELLSPRQKAQLTRIKSELNKGVKKLVNYFHWKLIDLQQYITYMLSKDKKTTVKKDTENENPKSQTNNRNRTEGEQQRTEEVAATHLKDPEDVTIQDVVHVATYWNIMASGRDMEFLNSITNKINQSIIRLVKSKGKETVLEAIKNTGNLLQSDDRYPVVTFSDFIKNSDHPDSRFNKILRRTTIDTRIDKSEQRKLKDKQYKFYLNYSPISYDNVPNFNSFQEAQSWFQENKKFM